MATSTQAAWPPRSIPFGLIALDRARLRESLSEGGVKVYDLTRPK